MAIYKITNKMASKCLNIHGNNVSTLKNHDAVTLWKSENTDEQRWEISSLGNGVFVRSVINSRFGLNVYRSGSPWDCDIYTIAGNETDAAINFIQSGDYYKIQLANYTSYYLTARGTADGSEVCWATTTNEDDQLWNCATDDLGQAVSDTSELSGLSELDLIARCIYAEARGESDVGRRGVACVIRNRKARGTTEFGGNTYSGVVLKSSAFSGMTSSSVLAPDTTSNAWTECVNIAKNIDTIANPIGTCLWFNTNSRYSQHSYTTDGVEYFSFSSGAREVVEKYIIGNHTFFKVAGY